MLSQEYIGAIAILLVSVLHMFHIEVGNDAVSGLLAGGIALWIAIRRHGKGDITVAGIKK